MKELQPDYKKAYLELVNYINNNFYKKIPRQQHYIFQKIAKIEKELEG
jgi:hypothetical protein